MKFLGILAVISVFGFFTAVPASGQACCHHGHHCDDCGACDHSARRNASSSRDYVEPSRATAALQTLDGQIREVVYLPGATSDTAFVEIRLESAGQTRLIRLAPTGFLKGGGILLREGDTVTVKGFPVSGMEGNLVVATLVQKGDHTLPLRDGNGRPAW